MTEVSNKEIEIIKLLAKPNKEIAKSLKISEGTVKTYIYRLFCKYPEAISRTGLLVEALRERIIKLEDIT